MLSVPALVTARLIAPPVQVLVLEMVMLAARGERSPAYRQIARDRRDRGDRQRAVGQTPGGLAGRDGQAMDQVGHQRTVRDGDAACVDLRVVGRRPYVVIARVGGIDPRAGPVSVAAPSMNQGTRTKWKRRSGAFRVYCQVVRRPQ
jgi:hypothetical protein